MPRSPCSRGASFPGSLRSQEKLSQRRELGRAALAKIGAGLSLLAILAVGGCAAPMSQREAVGLANTSLLKFCSKRGGCPQLRVAHAQKIKDRWLIEYDAAAN